MVKVLVCLLVSLLAAPAWPTLNHAPRIGSGSASIEIYRIRILNQADGPIEISRDGGQDWEAAGKVIHPATQVNKSGYTASKWVEDGVVAATAVNAIHVKTGVNPQNQRGIIFTISPQPSVQSLTSIQTDIAAGEKIFGGGFAPFVGNKVFALDPAELPFQIDSTYIPKIGDLLLIKVEIPKYYPKEIVFENCFGGEVTIEYFSGEKKVIGQVLQPVLGVGRFSGTKYAAPGRIRANHAGVIDVSTSPLGSIGGFQIIPALHGMSPEMGKARSMTQWMVVGSSLEGTAPLFKYFINPVYGEDLAQRFLVDVKLKGLEKWQPLPIVEFDEYYLKGDLPDWANTALGDVTHFRIFFPIY